MDAASHSLYSSLVAAYRPYLSKLAADHDIADSVDEGEAWLESELAGLLELPYVQQRRGPLEVFQESLRFVTDALAALGVPAPARTPPEEAALPGDTYGLAPASTQDLGEDVWSAHIAWGATKAGSVTTVCWFGRDLADRSKVESGAAAAGRHLSIQPDSLDGCGVVVIDLDWPEAARVLRDAAEGGWPAVAYGPHVDTERLNEAAELGALALPRSKFFADVASHLAMQPRRPVGSQDEVG